MRARTPALAGPGRGTRCGGVQDECGRRDDDLARAAVCCGVATGFLGVVAAKQLGWVRHLPDPPGGVWDSDGITGSQAARPLGIPDGLLGLGSYGVTLGLLVAARENEGARRVLRWKLAGDAGAAGFNAVRQVVSFGKVCAWCMGTAAATVGVVWFGWRGLRSWEPVSLGAKCGGPSPSLHSGSG